MNPQTITRSAHNGALPRTCAIWIAGAGAAVGAAVLLPSIVPVTFASLADGAVATSFVAGLKLLSLGGVLPLYNRLSKASTFENDTRKRIFDHVEEMPGACIADVAGKVGVSHSTASYHLDKLNEFNLITSTQDGNKVRFFVKGGAFSEDERLSLSALENAETRRVLCTIIAHPMSYRAELTELLGVSSPTVNWHLDRLTRAALVSETRSGRNRYLQAERGRVTRILSGLLSKLETTGKNTDGIETVLREVLRSENVVTRHAHRYARQSGEILQ